MYNFVNSTSSKLDEMKIKIHQKSNETDRLWIKDNLRNYSDA